MEDPPLRSRTTSFALLAAAVAGQLAFVVAPIGLHLDEVGAWVYWTAPLAPILFAYGWIQNSVTALLFGVPAAWFLVAYGLPGMGYGGSGAIIVVTLAYGGAAALWSAATDKDPSDSGRWRVESLEEVSHRPSPFPLLIAFVVTVSGIAVTVWPGLHTRAMGAFPGLGERVIVGLGIFGTLCGLLVAVALMRPRPPLSWRPARAIFLSVMFVTAAAVWWIV